MSTNPWDTEVDGGWIVVDGQSSQTAPELSLVFGRGLAHEPAAQSGILASALSAIAARCGAPTVDWGEDISIEASVLAGTSHITMRGPAPVLTVAWERLATATSSPGARLEFLAELAGEATVELPPWSGDAAVRTGLSSWSLAHLEARHIGDTAEAIRATATELLSPETRRISTSSSSELTDRLTSASSAGDSETFSSPLEAGRNRTGLFAMQPSALAFSAVLPHSETGAAAAVSIAAQLGERATTHTEPLGDALLLTASTLQPVTDAQRAELAEAAFAGQEPAQDLAAACRTAERLAQDPSWHAARAFSSREFEPSVSPDAVRRVLELAHRTLHLPWASPDGLAGWEWAVKPLQIEAQVQEFRGWQPGVLATLGQDTLAVGRLAEDGIKPGASMDLSATRHDAPPGTAAGVTQIAGLDTQAPAAVLVDDVGPHTWIDTSLRTVIAAPEAFRGQLAMELEELFAQAPRLQAAAPAQVQAAREAGVRGRRRRNRGATAGAIGALALTAGCIAAVLTFG